MFSASSYNCASAPLSRNSTQNSLYRPANFPKTAAQALGSRSAGSAPKQPSSFYAHTGLRNFLSFMLLFGAVLYSCESPSSAKSGTPSRPKAWHVTTLAGGGSAGADGIGSAAGFGGLFSITQIGNTLYVVDTSRHSIRTIDTNTARVGTIVTGSSSGGYSNGDGTTARFDTPTAILAAADGSTLYVADYGNGRVRKVTIGADAAAARVSDLAGKVFGGPGGLALSGDTLYVADYGSHRIRAVNLNDNTVSTIAGDGTDGYRDGPGRTARFKNPSGLAVSGDTLFVADSLARRIRVIDIASRTVSDIAGQRSFDGISKDGIGSAASFNGPMGITVSGNTLYVSTLAGLIRKLEYK